MSTSLHASSNFTVSVQLANKRGLKILLRTRYAVCRHVRCRQVIIAVEYNKLFSDGQDKSQKLVN
jgi:hypothetical protein